MLIDDDKEELGELEIEEQKIEQKPELPEKYRDKSLDEIVKLVVCNKGAETAIP